MQENKTFKLVQLGKPRKIVKNGEVFEVILTALVFTGENRHTRRKKAKMK